MNNKAVIIGCLYETHGSKTTIFKSGHAAVYSPKGISPTLVTMTGGVINLL